MKYMAIDPSFSRTGLCILDTDTKTIFLKPISPPGSNKTFNDTVNRGMYIAEQIIKEISHLHNITMLIEEPMISSIKASSLGVLSGILTTTLTQHPSIKTVYTVNPNTIRQLNSALSDKKGLSKKQISFLSAEVLFAIFEQEGYTISLWTNTPRKRKFCHDEAEAFMLCILLLLKDNVLSDSLVQNIYAAHKGYSVKKIKINEFTKREVTNVAKAN